MCAHPLIDHVIWFLRCNLFRRYLVQCLKKWKYCERHAKYDRIYKDYRWRGELNFHRRSRARQRTMYLSNLCKSSTNHYSSFHPRCVGPRWRSKQRTRRGFDVRGVPVLLCLFLNSICCGILRRDISERIQFPHLRQVTRRWINHSTSQGSLRQGTVSHILVRAKERGNWNSEMLAIGLRVSRNLGHTFSSFLVCVSAWNYNSQVLFEFVGSERLWLKYCDNHDIG